MSDLLPCPFCGGEAELTGFDAPEYWVWCPNCKASTDAHTCKGGAIEAWNTRAERTCRNISDPPEGFYCSSCHWGDFAEPSHLLTASKYTGRESGGPNYCPNCGAKVVSE